MKSFIHQFYAAIYRNFQLNQDFRCFQNALNIVFIDAISIHFIYSYSL